MVDLRAGIEAFQRLSSRWRMMAPMSCDDRVDAVTLASCREDGDGATAFASMAAMLRYNAGVK